MKLIKIKINSFKGIKEKEIDFDEKSTSIIGKNGAGKTTIYDAFNWVLFGKDSQDKANFDIRNYNTDEMAEVFVEVVHESGSLARKYSKVEEKKTHKGVVEINLVNDYDYFVDGISTTKTKFNKKVAEFVGENPEIFKILSNIYYLLSIMPWKKRREFLIDMFGKVSEQELLKRKKFKELLEYLGDKDINKAKDIIAFEMKKNKTSLEKIETKIDEVEKQRNAVSEKDSVVAENEITELKKELNKLEKDLDNVNSGNKTEINNKIKELELEKKELINNAEKQSIENSKVFTDKKQIIQENINFLSSRINDLRFEESNVRLSNKMMKEKEETDKKELHKLNTEREELRKEFYNINSLEFDSDKTICYECGQKYPEGKIEEIIKLFADKKQKDKETIQEKGKKIASRIEELNSFKYEYKSFDESSIEKVMAEKSDLEKDLTEISEKIKNCKVEADTTEIDKLINYEKNKLDKIDLDNSDMKKELSDKISELKKTISEKEEIIFRFRENGRADERIKEINEEEKKLKEISQNLAYWKYQIDNFEKEFCSINESIINDNFKNVKFKLFDIQVNGGLNQVCEAMIDNSPFNTNLNTGSKILAGLETIEVLSEKLGMKFPVFIDNRESLTTEIKTDLQTISLIALDSDIKTNSNKEISL